MLQHSKEKLRHRRATGEGGFTLVELIVVIAILGILAGIVVFAVSGLGDKGQATADKTTCSILQTAEEAYFASPTAGNGAYATDTVHAAFPTATDGQDALIKAKLLHTRNDAFSITGDGTAYAVSGPNCS
jgi:general secretion pathway protein G